MLASKSTGTDGPDEDGWHHDGTAFEALPAIGWALTGPEHVVVAANRAARAVASAAGPVLGRPLREVLSGTAARTLLPLLSQAFRTGATLRGVECRVALGPDGTEGYASLSTAPRRSSNGDIIGLVVLLIDTTGNVRDRLAAEAGARRSEELRAQEHDIAQALQQSLLPNALPVLPGVRLAARYITASSALSAGGDWYDAISLGDGRLAVSVGDVVGSGPEAAAVMGQLRSALTAYLLAGMELGEVITRLGEFARHVPHAAGATACVAVLDPVRGELSYSSAAHPPIVWARPGRPAVFLPRAAGFPLALGDGDFEVRTARVEPGDLLVLYSDGAVDRPDASPHHSAAALLACAGQTAAAKGSVDQRCEQLLDALLAGGLPEDDIALLMLRVQEPATPLHRVVPARSDQLGALRRDLRDWLEEGEIDGEDALAAQIAAGEATANAVEHAYPHEDPGPVTLTADLERTGTLHLSVRDEGSWRAPTEDPEGRGRGLLLMQAAMDSVRVRHSETGTTIDLRRRLGSGPGREVEPGSDALALDIEHRAEGPLVRLRGAIDATTVHLLRPVLRRTCRGGALEMTVDLAAVSYLASAGVRMFFELAAEAASAGGRLVLCAPAGTSARYVARLTGLDAYVEMRTR
ncbi:anti-anti-sigma factor [Crossiella equi]|uniref:Anti-anti-sigma factor n=1 Tax=Crossiella equi TaxID=130796 RepID=A0ABS5ALE7_9PSEU|nr:SpoIIE family protein phosphatase [Crossiella equi]MBP2477393.1 anti-anti-sigma factor [Crossiella equi]